LCSIWHEAETQGLKLLYFATKPGLPQRNQEFADKILNAPNPAIFQARKRKPFSPERKICLVAVI
jgi:hypothetical protein